MKDSTTECFFTFFGDSGVEASFSVDIVLNLMVLGSVLLRLLHVCGPHLHTMKHVFWLRCNLPLLRFPSWFCYTCFRTWFYYRLIRNRFGLVIHRPRCRLHVGIMLLLFPLTLTHILHCLPTVFGYFRSVATCTIPSVPLVVVAFLVALVVVLWIVTKNPLTNLRVNMAKLVVIVRPSSLNAQRS